MTTCTNCRYELRAGQDACPMCGEPAPGPAPDPRRRASLGLGLVAGLGALLVAGAAGLHGAPRPRATAAGGQAGASPSPCPPARLQPVSKPSFPAPPSETLSPSRRYSVVFETSCGTFEVALDVARAPKTTSSVAFLVRRGFYDGLGFHRAVPNFVIQGGDPRGDGTGGPGYVVVEPPPAGLRYQPGIVAMAKTQLDPPGTSGSQFFVVTGPLAAQLPAEYALVGRVVRGMDVVHRIEVTPPGQVVIRRARLVSG